MKKALFLLSVAAFSVSLFGCGSANTSSSIESINPNDLWDEKYIDPTNDFGTFDSVKVLKDNVYLDKAEESFDKSGDYKYEFYSGDNMRYVNLSSGYAITLEKDKYKIDTTLSRFAVKFTSNEGQLRISYEDVDPYSHDKKGYDIYTSEWLFPYLRKEQYLVDNNFEYFENPMVESTELRDDLAITCYYVNVKNPVTIEFPYYHIALVRKKSHFSDFHLVLYKAKRADVNYFKGVLRGISLFSEKGKAKNNLPKQKALPNPRWNEETKKYYEYLLNKQYPGFGFFRYSMDNVDGDNPAEFNAKILEENNFLEKTFDTTFEIMPTYAHLNWAGTPMRFSQGAHDLAGGNGFDGKRVLQYTYQFTENNNSVYFGKDSDLSSPMFKILRGEFDKQFHQLARDIKAYKQPILFRLNNEMNTDWTTYCGLFNLIDPDIFKQTWIHLYNIFENEKVDNCIWIFNPFDTSKPSSSWGEDLNYYPGNEYVQALGLTSYEFNNYNEENTNNEGRFSFKTRFETLYQKNSGTFDDMPAIVSEFGCAAGGATTGDLGRNEDYQATWVLDMFKELAAGRKYTKYIKEIVWFNTNDMDGDLIKNYLNVNASLTKTCQAFKEGFALLKEAEANAK